MKESEARLVGRCGWFVRPLTRLAVRRKESWRGEYAWRMALAGVCLG